MRLANTPASHHSRRRWLGATPSKSSLILRKALESGVSRQQDYNPGPLVTTLNCFLPSQPLLRDLQEVRPHPHLKILPIFGQWMQLSVSRSQQSIVVFSKGDGKPGSHRLLPRRLTGHGPCLQQRWPSSGPQTFRIRYRACLGWTLRCWVLTAV